MKTLTFLAPIKVVLYIDLDPPHPPIQSIFVSVFVLLIFLGVLYLCVCFRLLPESCLLDNTKKYFVPRISYTICIVVPIKLLTNGRTNKDESHYVINVNRNILYYSFRAYRLLHSRLKTLSVCKAIKTFM